MALISGLPAGINFDQGFVDRELWRRQQGYGRGGRMRIERDHAHVISGVRHGRTIGSPIAFEIRNNDWKNWEESLPVEAGDATKHKAVKSPLPGHADSNSFTKRKAFGTFATGKAAKANVFPLWRILSLPSSIVTLSTSESRQRFMPPNSLGAMKTCTSSI